MLNGNHARVLLKGILVLAVFGTSGLVIRSREQARKSAFITRLGELKSRETLPGSSFNQWLQNNRWIEVCLPVIVEPTDGTAILKCPDEHGYIRAVYSVLGTRGFFGKLTYSNAPAVIDEGGEDYTWKFSLYVDPHLHDRGAMTLP